MVANYIVYGWIAAPALNYNKWLCYGRRSFIAVVNKAISLLGQFSKIVWVTKNGNELINIESFLLEELLFFWQFLIFGLILSSNDVILSNANEHSCKIEIVYETLSHIYALINPLYKNKKMEMSNARIIRNIWRNGCIKKESVLNRPLSINFEHCPQGFVFLVSFSLMYILMGLNLHGRISMSIKKRK